MERMALLTIVTSVFCLLVAGQVWGGAAGPGAARCLGPRLLYFRYALGMGRFHFS